MFTIGGIILKNFVELKSNKIALIITLLAYYSFLFYNTYTFITFHLDLGLPMAGISENARGASTAFKLNFFVIFFLINFIGLIITSTSTKKIHTLLIPVLSIPFLIKGYLDNINLFNPTRLFDIKLFTPLSDSQKIIFFNQPGFKLEPFHDIWVFKFQIAMLYLLFLLFITYMLAIIINTEIKSKRKLILLCSVITIFGVLQFEIIKYLFTLTFVFLLINSWKNQNEKVSFKS